MMKRRFLQMNNVYQAIHRVGIWGVLMLGVCTNIMAEDTALQGIDDNEVTVASPSFKVKLLYYHPKGRDSFWEEAPKLYVNNEYIATLSGLAMDGEGKADNYRTEDGDVAYHNSSNYIVRVYDPYGEGGIGKEDFYWLQMEILPRNIDPEMTFTVKVVGRWNPDRDGAREVTKTWTSGKAENLFPESLGTYSRSADGVIEYSKNGMKELTNGFAYELGFYKTSSYNDSQRFHFARLATDATSTEKNCSWIGNPNNLPTDVYHRMWISNDACQLGSKTYSVKFCKTYGKSMVPGYVKAVNVNVQPNQWKKSVKLNWESSGTKDGISDNGKWGIWYYPKEEGVQAQQLLNSVPVGTFQYEHTTDLGYDTDYSYTVGFIPNSWNSDVPTKDLSETAQTRITREYPIKLELKPNEASIGLEWICGPLEGSEKYEFVVKRRKNNDTNWETVGTVAVTDKNKTSYTYESDNITSSCDTYHYQVSITMMEGETFASNTVSGSIDGATYIKKMLASKGAYSNMVKVGWSVHQVGTTETKFMLYRRLLNGQDDDWSMIYTISGTDETYSYEDVTAIPGQYYEYKVTSSYNCNGSDTTPTGLSTDGFCMATGTVSGRITYDSGTAVSGVRVNVLKTSDSDQDAKTQFYSLRVDNAGGGILLDIDAEKAESLYGAKKNFTMQMWVNFDDDIRDSNDTTRFSTPMLMDVYNNFSLFAKRQADGIYRMVMRLPGSKNIKDYETDILLVPNQYHHLSFSHKAKERKWTLTVVDSKGMMRDTAIVAEEAIDLSDATKPGITFGTNLSDASQFDFKGYIDEIRCWNKVLDSNEIQNNYGHLLGGTESGLKIYYPLDENVSGQQTAYDYSRTSGVANANHGHIRPSSRPSGIVPTAEQFGLYTYTDEDGNFTLRGIPFSSDGTSYNICPVMGIHEFSPNKSACFVSANSLVHSNVSFEDVSSFPVSGVVYYENTTYPVEGCFLKVDGVTCMRDGEVVTTDSEGRFTISVPIGDHYISIEKNGHVFANEGFYPAKVDGEKATVTFNREINGLTFTDVTKAVVVGRVAGGSIQEELPLGFGQGKNNIGQAELKLKTGHKMNVALRTEGGAVQYVNAGNPISYAGATERIASTATVGGGDDEAVRTITIHTDPATGEFSVLLPPVKYEVVSASIPKNADVTFGNIPYIDASEILQTTTDTLYNDGVAVDSFTYNASLELIHREPSRLVVTDNGNSNGAFGERMHYFTDINGKKDSLMLYEVIADGSVKYNYDYPIFVQDRNYSFAMEAFEEYANYDNDAENPDIDRVPLSGVYLNIANEFGVGNTVSIEGETDGQLVELAENELKLDEGGKATYSFRAGLPNIQPPYSLGMNISYSQNGNTLSWSENGKFKVILLGSLPTGNNFITKGPDEVMMVLRDPPGSNSSASWKSGTVLEYKKQSGGRLVSDSEFVTLTKLGNSATIATGTLGMATITSLNNKWDLTVGATLEEEGTFVDPDAGGIYEVKNITTTEIISTSDDPNFVGAVGDIFIGAGTNLLFGKAREVGFHLNDTGEYVLNLKDVVTFGQEYTTGFKYTQYYIEQTLIPNLRNVRNSYLLPMNSNAQRQQQSVRFVSKLPETDPRYGSRNDDYNVWKDDTTSALDGPSYTILTPTDESAVWMDSVLYYNEQIELWENELQFNEQLKVEAMATEGRNISFDAGSIYQHTHESSMGDKGRFIENTIDSRIKFGADIGAEINETGVIFSLHTATGGGSYYMVDSITSNLVATEYTLAESGDDDALSVDIFDCPNGWGPVFSTRGGQTSCPYEGKVVTKYYAPGTTLSEATMQIEVPAIRCENPIQTGIPAGGTAYFTLELQNNSEVDLDQWFDLSLVEESNPYGASLLLDGDWLGRSFLIPAGKSLKKTLAVSQGDPTCLDIKDIKIRLSSQCQNDQTKPFGEIADTVNLSAYFVPACSDIRLQIPTPVVNSITGSRLTLKVDRYDLNYRSLKGICLQMKAEGDADWKLVKEYVTDSTLVDKNRELLDQPELTYVFDMDNKALYPDAHYLFRAITVCNFGEGDVNNESEEISVVKDMYSPMLIGTASPSDGILHAGDEISILFNEDIRSGSLTMADNFYVRGILNDCEVAHNVAYRAGKGYAATTESSIDLSNRSFAVNLWMNYTEAGTIFRHGTTSNELVLGVDEAGHLTFFVGGKNYTSSETVPKDIWNFLSVSVTFDEGNTALSADIAYDASNVNLFNAQLIGEYNGNGPLSIGEGLTGIIHEVTLWNYARTSAEAFNGMYTTKAAHTQGLIGYWKFDEGHGTSATDVARSRHMTLPGQNAWFFNNVNKALDLDGSRFAAIPLYASPSTSEDNCLVEFWFKGQADAQTDTVSLFTMGDGGLNLQVAGSKMELVIKGVSNTVSTSNYLDGTWHHLALNVLKGIRGSVIVYVDGEAVKQFAAEQFPALSSDYFYLGVLRKQNDVGTDNYIHPFVGQFDEFRYWKGHFTAEFIRQNMYNRVSADASGLVAYYPFEEQKVDQYNQTVYEPSLSDADSAREAVQVLGIKHSLDVEGWHTDDAPPLKAAPLMQNVQYSFVASDRKVLITLEEDASRIEGCTLFFTVSDVRDAANNLSNPVTWTAYIRQNRLNWDTEEMEFSGNRNEDNQFTAAIVNTGAETEYWSLSGLPLWLQVDIEAGELKPQSEQKVRFTVLPSAPAGHSECVVYLTGNQGVEDPLIVQFSLLGNRPDWRVNAATESTMSLIGKMVFTGGGAENTKSILAAFVDTLCVGVASPVYQKRYDAYYLMMNIYGDESLVNKDVRFKIYDASADIVYPLVSASQDVVYVSDEIVGSMGTPVVFIPTADVEQTIPLSKGWKWISLGVLPVENSVSSVMQSVSGTAELIKSKSEFAQYDGTSWKGTLQTFSPKQMYKVHSSESSNLYVSGSSVSLRDTQIEICQGWNWIGYPLTAPMSVSTALAGLSPEDGDIVKSQNAFSVFDDYEWQGNLEALMPGEGYVYYSSASQTKQLVYPAVVATRALLPAGNLSDEEYVYPGNMTMVARVMDGTNPVQDAIVSVSSADGEVRARSICQSDESLHFITVQGEGQSDVLDIVVERDGEIVSTGQTLPFVEDSMLGTPSSPYIIQLQDSDLSGCIVLRKNDGQIILSSASSLADVRLYDTEGRTLNIGFVADSSSTFIMNLLDYAPGVYILTATNTDGIQRTFSIVR